MTIRLTTGQAFGSLRVLERSHATKRGVWWLCRCDCGADTTVLAQRLIARKTRSCGCLQREWIELHNAKRARDLTGRRFGRLKVTEFAFRRRDRGLFWHCQCRCGQVWTVSTSDLLSGGVRSCGCLRRERLAQALKQKRTAHAKPTARKPRVETRRAGLQSGEAI